jgi:TATA-box binding protein (TBP) (component of TFIID and TFIIIB)
MKLKNIKASFIFGEDLIEKRNGTEKLIFKEKNVTFTIYKHTPDLLNVTGVKSLAQLKSCKEEMEKHFEKKIKEERIDNLFFSKKDKKNIDLDQLSIYLQGHKKYFASYHHELFPGMHLLPKDKSFPTIVLFRTGSFTLMGSKNLNAIFESELFVESLIDMFEK